MKKFIILIIFLLAILISAIFYINKSSPNTIMLKINNQVFILEKAITPEEKAKGLMFIRELDNNTGMIFIWEYERARTFWMKNMLIPLDIIFLNKDKKIIDIKENFNPCESEPCPSYISKPAMYAIEINAGLSEKLNLTLGDEIDLDY